MAQPRRISDSRNLDVSTDDSTLWQAVQAENKKAFQLIYDKYADHLYRYGFHLIPDQDLVKDALQDVFVRVWESKSKLTTIHNIQAYLLTAMRHRVLECSAQYKTMAKRQFNYQVEIADTAEENHLLSSFKNEEEEQKRNAITEVLPTLPDRQQEVIYLLFYKCLSYDNVAEIMGINTRSVYTLAWKATEGLRKKIKKLSPVLFIVSILILFMVSM